MRATVGPSIPWFTAMVFALAGLALGAGSFWLAPLGRFWLYFLMGLALLAIALLLLRGRAAALAVHAALVVSTLAWTLWAHGLDWWELAVHAGALTLGAVWLLMPWVRRGLTAGREPSLAGSMGLPPRASAFHGAGLFLTVALALALGVGTAALATLPSLPAG